MLWFWLITVAILGFVCVICFVALHMMASKTQDQNSFARDFYQAKHSELKGDLKSGLIDESEFKALENELARRILKQADKNQAYESIENQAGTTKITGKIPILLLAMMLCLSSYGAYLYTGSPGLPDFPIKSERAQFFASMQQNPESAIAQMVANLEGKLVDNPDHYQGWQQLLRSYRTLNDIDGIKRALKGLYGYYERHEDELSTQQLEEMQAINAFFMDEDKKQ